MIWLALLLVGYVAAVEIILVAEWIGGPIVHYEENKDALLEGVG